MQVGTYIVLTVFWGQGFQAFEEAQKLDNKNNILVLEEERSGKCG